MPRKFIIVELTVGEINLLQRCIELAESQADIKVFQDTLENLRMALTIMPDEDGE